MKAGRGARTVLLSALALADTVMSFMRERWDKEKK